MQSNKLVVGSPEESMTPLCYPSSPLTTILYICSICPTSPTTSPNLMGRMVARLLGCTRFLARDRISAGPLEGFFGIFAFPAVFSLVPPQM